MASTTAKHTIAPQAEQDEVATKKARVESNANTTTATHTIAIPASLSQQLPLLGLLWRTNVIHIMPSLEGKLYMCQRDTKLVDCFKGLVDHNVTSCPVMTKKGEKFFNFIETIDIVNFVVDHFKTTKSLSDSKNFWGLIQQEERFEKLTVNDVAKWPMTRKSIDSLPLPKDYSLLLACECMFKEQNLHRLAVVDSIEHRKLLSVITQSRLVKFLHDNIDFLGDRKNKTVADFHSCFHNVKVINMNAEAIDGFALMAKLQFTGLPVVDDHGQLVAIMSSRDVKGMAVDGSLFWRLYQRVWQFLDRVRHDYPSRPHGSLYCKKTDTLEKVIKLVVEHGIHRLPIVESDADKKVIGIVALRDILCATLLA